MPVVASSRRNFARNSPRRAKRAPRELLGGVDAHERSLSNPGLVRRASSLLHALRDCAPIDLRALALFRIAFGLVLFVDLVQRTHAGNLAAFYTDDGLFPLSGAQAAGAPSHPTLFTLATTTSSAAWLTAVIALTYGLYTIGFATPLLQLLVAVACLSLDARAPMLRNSGTDVLNTLAVWTLLLPLGARFSVDAWRREGAPRRGTVRSVATFGLTLNLALIYLLSVVQKTGATWRDGTAVHYVLWSNRYGTSLAARLREHERAWFSPTLTYATLLLEGALPLLILSPWFHRRARTVAVVLVLSFHGALALTMTLGCFPYVMQAGSLLLLDAGACRSVELRAGRLWQRITRGVRRRPLRRKPATGDAERPSGAARLANDARMDRMRIFGREAFATLILLAVLSDASMSNAIVPASMQLGRLARLTSPVTESLGIHQHWNLFTPDPLKREATLLIDARLADGTHVDPLTGKLPDLRAPEKGPYLDGSQWLHVKGRLLQGRNAVYRSALWAYVLRTSVREHLDDSKRVVALTAYRVSGTLPSPGSTEWTRVTAEPFFSWPNVLKVPAQSMKDEPSSSEDGAL